MFSAGRRLFNPFRVSNRGSRRLPGVLPWAELFNAFGAKESYELGSGGLDHRLLSGSPSGYLCQQKKPAHTHGLSFR
jgi:hypothetical protein